MDLPGRIKHIIEKSGLSLPAFAERVGVSRNTLVSYRDGVTSPSVDFLEKVCMEFGTDRRWLILGDGEPGEFERQLEATVQKDGTEGCLTTEEYVLVPLLESWVRGGPEGEILYEGVADYYPFKRYWVDRLVGKSEERQKKLVLVKVRGDSMAPTISQGEVALADTYEGERVRIKTGDIYIVTLPDGSTAIKRLALSRTEDGLNYKITCMSDNTAAYKPFDFVFPLDKRVQDYVLGRVRWAGKEFD